MNTLVVDYQNLDYFATQELGRYVDLVELARQAEISASARIKNRFIFVSDRFLQGLSFDQKRNLEKEIDLAEFQVKIVFVSPGFANRTIRQAMPDLVDLAIESYCLKEIIVGRDKLVLASSDGDFSSIVKKYKGWVLFYDQPAKRLQRAANGRCLRVEPGKRPWAVRKIEVVQ